MHMELADCTNVLLSMIPEKECTQSLVADYYAMALVSSWPTDWRVVNEAILARWPKGLTRVKEKAWKIVEQKKRERLAAIAETN